MNAKPQGLFLNHFEAPCSIYESGKMVYDCLRLSDQFELDYLSIDADHREIPNQYDFYAFNYHFQTMAWLDPQSIKQLPGLKLTFVLEVSPNDPFPLCPDNAFDVYCAIDPTMDSPDSRVYAFPRPLEHSSAVMASAESPIPIIGSFGFATPGKGFERIVAAVNEEFDEAIVKINMSANSACDEALWPLQRRPYSAYFEALCKQIAKPGIHVEVTRDYFEKSDLINWCSQNTLNCFLYDRFQPGLCATADQAIASGRPLLTSACETFRHIHPYIKPYPLQTLRQAIETSQPQVLRMQQDWSQQQFATAFESMLKEQHIFETAGKNISTAGTTQLKIETNPIIGVITPRQPGGPTIILRKEMPTPTSLEPPSHRNKSQQFLRHPKKSMAQLPRIFRHVFRHPRKNIVNSWQKTQLLFRYPRRQFIALYQDYRLF